MAGRSPDRISDGRLNEVDPPKLARQLLGAYLSIHAAGSVAPRCASPQTRSSTGTLALG